MSIKDSLLKVRRPNNLEDTQQRQIEDFIRSTASLKILQGNLIKDVTVGATGVDFPVNHRLQRAWEGYFVVKSNYPLRAYSGTAHEFPDYSLNLRAEYSGASAPPVIDLWVF